MADGGQDGRGLGITIMGGDVRTAAAISSRAEYRGFESVWTAEFYDRSAAVSLAAMAATTRHARLGSSIMYAFGRSPVLLTTEARDLDELSGGRFVLGVGTGTTGQVKDWHGLDPEHLAPRLEELVPLVRQLWNLDQGPVRHDGRFYHVKIFPASEMAPPLRREIPIYVAAVNRRMIEAAGRVGDGLCGHPLYSPEYVDEVVRPALYGGAQGAGRTTPVPIAGYVLCSVAETTERARRAAAAQIAFYTVVRTFEPILTMHGFHEEAVNIRNAFRNRDMDAAIAAVSDRMLDTFACYGTAEEAVQRYRSRFAGVYEEPLLFAPSVGHTAGPHRVMMEAVIDSFTAEAVAAA
ncbi:MAG: LLM class flavin-dependent oxidoreductase [Candidatus Dormiibacterota bacterium]